MVGVVVNIGCQVRTHTGWATSSLHIQILIHTSGHRTVAKPSTGMFWKVGGNWRRSLKTHWRMCKTPAKRINMFIIAQVKCLGINLQICIIYLYRDRTTCSQARIHRSTKSHIDTTKICKRMTGITVPFSVFFQY